MLHFPLLFRFAKGKSMLNLENWCPWSFYQWSSCRYHLGMKRWQDVKGIALELENNKGCYTLAAASSARACIARYKNKNKKMLSTRWHLWKQSRSKKRGGETLQKLHPKISLFAKFSSAGLCKASSSFTWAGLVEPILHRIEAVVQIIWSSIQSQTTSPNRLCHKNLENLGVTAYVKKVALKDCGIWSTAHASHQMCNQSGA